MGFLDIPRSVVDELEEHQLRVCVCTQQSLEHPTKLRSTSLLDFILEKFEVIEDCFDRFKKNSRGMRRSAECEADSFCRGPAASRKSTPNKSSAWRLTLAGSF